MTSMMPVQPSHSRKPDPDQPWRYVCPECGRQVNGSMKQPNDKFRCHEHGQFTFDELEDQAK
jgi:hypothetical protein